MVKRNTRKKVNMRLGPVIRTDRRTDRRRWMMGWLTAERIICTHNLQPYSLRMCIMIMELLPLPNIDIMVCKQRFINIKGIYIISKRVITNDSFRRLLYLRIYKKTYCIFIYIINYIYNCSLHSSVSIHEHMRASGTMQVQCMLNRSVTWCFEIISRRIRSS